MYKRLIFILFFCLYGILRADMFSDVPVEHWAYDAISELAGKGYMDGYYDNTFKGEKPVSRYELATIVSRMLTKMYNMESSGSFINEEEAATIRKLITEFKDELKAISNRFDGIETRLKKVEEEQKSSKKQDKFSLSGDYETGSVYNHKALPKTSYNDTSLGFHGLGQSIKFYFTMNPDDKTEIFLKTSTSLNGSETNDILKIRSTDFVSLSSEKKVVTSATYGGREVDVTTSSGTATVLQKDGTNDVVKTESSNLTDKYLKNGDYQITEGDKNLFRIEEIHLKLNPHNKAKIRIFSNQGQSSYDNYVRIMTSGWEWEHTNPWQTYGGVYSGIEVNGALTKDFSYMSSYLRHRNNESDTVGLRLKYNFPSTLLDNATLFLGTTVTESIDNYEDFGAFHIYNGIDFNYALKKSYTLNIDGEIMRLISGAADKTSFNEPKGIKIDATYGFKSLKSYFNFYRYDQDFKIFNGHVLNYYDRYRYDYAMAGRNEYLSLDGERRVKMSTRYDYPLKGGKSLRIEGMWTRLWWDKEDNTTNYYNYMGEIYELKLSSRMSENVSATLTTFQHKDPKPDEIGKWKTVVDINTTLIKEKNCKLNLSISSQRDPDVAAGSPTDREQSVSGDISWDVNKKVWMKIDSVANVSSIGTADEKTSTEINANTTVSLTDALSATGFYHWEHDKNADAKSHVYRLVLTNQFTSKLKVRYGFWRWTMGDASVVCHHNADVSYSASEKTSLNIALSPTDYNGYNWFDRWWSQVPTVQRVQFTLNSSF